MEKRKKIFQPFALFLAAAFAVLGLSGCGDSRAKEAVAKERGDGVVAGAVSAPFKISTFDGGTFSLEAVKGNPVVINFWGSWCAPCRMEASEFRKAHEEFKGAGVVFVGVAVQDSDEGARAFVREYGWGFPAGHDSTGEIMRAYNVFGVPKTVVVGRDGRYSYVHTGTIDLETLSKAIKRAL